MVESRLAPKGGGAGLAALIPRGMRAVAIRVNEIVGVAGFAVPGMRVDVLVSGSPPGAAAQGGVTKTLLQNVQVLSAGQNFQKDAEGKPVSVPVVNLLVTPEQAEMLSLASTQTSIQLVLRNPLDTDIAKTNGQRGRAVVPCGRAACRKQPEPGPGGQIKAAPVRPTLPPAALPPAPQPRVVEVIHGIKRTETQFEAPGEAQAMSRHGCWLVASLVSGGAAGGVRERWAPGGFGGHRGQVDRPGYAGRSAARGGGQR